MSFNITINNINFKCFKSLTENFTINKKYCIAILTRGYSDISKYQELIKRNKHISNNLKNKSIDNLIFHENNITPEQQTYIKNQTPELNIIFINILNHAFKKNKENIVFEYAHDFGIGYRHMCSFWFIDFFHFVKDYSFLLRIDEDCFINFSIDDILLKLDNYTFITGIEDIDMEFVTYGLNNFSINFMKKYYNMEVAPKNPGGPYTNVIGFSLNKIRENKMFQKYMNEINFSEMIYKRRWGDLPLWGEVIHYIFSRNSLKIDKDIKYLHGSHNKEVNI
jgi:hypothetical protein